MTLQVRDEDALVLNIAAIEANDDGGDPLRVTIGQVRDAAGVAKTFWQSMSASAAPVEVSGYGNTASPVDITVGPVTVTVVGGVAPFTYAWSTDPDWTVDAPTAATTTLTADDVGAGSSASAYFTCTVTDDTGAEAETNQVLATAVNLGGGA